MKVSRFASLSWKNGFVYVDQNLHFQPFPNIQSFRRFDWSFLQVSKYIYGKLWYKEKLFGKFQGLLCFTRKIVSYSLTKLGNFQCWTNNIPWLRRFTIGFWETSKQIYRKLRRNGSSRPDVSLGKGVLKIYSKFKEEHSCQIAISINLQSNPTEIALRHECPPVNLLYIFRTPFPENTSGRLLLGESFRRVWLGFPRKIVLYLLAKFSIFEPCTNIQFLRRFHWSFLQTSNHI